MDDSKKAIFEKLQNEVTDMHYRWKMYREIYAGSPEQTKLLNKKVCDFFYYVQRLMTKFENNKKEIFLIRILLILSRYSLPCMLLTYCLFSTGEE